MNKVIHWFVFLALLSTSAGSLAAQTARGVVFEDGNENGVRDAGEPGIARVGVSNGREVVLTEEDGQYTLPVGDDNTIFVIKPEDYRLPLNELNLPQFYYIHKPAGSPELEYAGIAPTGPLPASVDFPLIAAAEPDTFTALFFGDPQPYNLTEVGYFARDIVAELVGVDDIAFGMSLGDLVGNDLDLFQPLNEAVARIGMPWFNVYGNHDMNFDAAADELADETFEATYGPTTYAFNMGEVHFIVLDDVIYPRPDGERGYIGGLHEDQLEFVENTLRHVPTDHLVVLAFHIPIFLEKPFGETFRIADRTRLFELLEDYPHTLSLSGHTHTQRHHFFQVDEDWLREEPHHHYNVGTTSGDWWSGTPNERGIPDALMRDGTPNGYALITFTGNEYLIDYRVAGSPADHRMNIYAPAVAPRNESFRGEVYVNFFQGSERSTVEFRVENGDWRPMRKVNEQDPIVSLRRVEWDTSERLLEGARPSNPVLSKHLWKARLPTDLPLGEQVIEVRATDMFGRTFHGRHTYRIVDPAAPSRTTPAP